MSRKAKAGHVTGGRVFGYDNVEVLGISGERSHVTRKINGAEAAVVRRIFELSAAGAGLTRITKTLNEEGAPAARAQRGRPTAWASSSVREVLLRPLYRGEIVWNQTRKRDAGDCRTGLADRVAIGCACRRPTSRSSPTSCGRLHRRDSTNARRSTPNWGAAASTRNPVTFYQASRGVLPAVEAWRPTAGATVVRGCSSTAARRSGDGARRCARTTS